MRNFFNFSLVSALAAMSLASCQERLDGPASADGNAVIAASIVDPSSSRSAIDPTAYSDGNVGILWTPEDALGVFSAYDLNAKFENQATAPQGRTEFSGNLNGEPLYAYYPYSPDNDGRAASDLIGEIPASQPFDAATSAVDGDYKYGKLRAGSDKEFDFTHLFSLLKVSVKADGTALEKQLLKSVTLTFPEAVAGKFSFSAINGSYKMDADASNSVEALFEDETELTSGKTATAYVSAAPSARAGDVVEIKIATATHYAAFKAEITMDFTPNALYAFNLNLSDFADAAHGFSVEEIPAEPEEETANCYMITSAGEHSFKATVIGNGEKGIIKGAGFHTEDPYINPKSAKMLWEDAEGFITDVKLVDGRVIYTAGSNVGNAVIAVYSGLDCTGDILWSWHIWGVGDTLPGDFELATNGGSSFTMMDRDLGAFPATNEQRMMTVRDEETESRVLHAMLYQWGRKDPFTNSSLWYANGEAVSEHSVLKPETEDEATIDLAVKNPATVIDLYTTCKVSDWLGPHNDLLWGDDKFSGNNESGWTNVKTIYDPSPVGYRVPNYYAFTSFIPNNSVYQQLKGVMSLNSSTNVPSLAGVFNCVIDTVMDGTTARWLPMGIHQTKIGTSVDSKSMHGYGVYMKRFENDTEGNFFPMTGYLTANGKRSDYGIGVYHWMSCGAVTNTDDAGASFLYYFAWRTASSNTGVNKGLPTGGAGVVGTVRSQYSLQPRYACPIRPVRE